MTGARLRRTHAASGQALVLMVGGMCAVLAGALIVAAVARGLESRADAQRAADLAALAGARALLDAYPLRLGGADTGGSAQASGGSGMSAAEYLAVGRRAARSVAERNGGGRVTVEFGGGDPAAPTRVRVRVRRKFTVLDGGERAATDVAGDATAELAPLLADLGPAAGSGEYTGPLARRQGVPMRPDVAQAFDRMSAAARADGVRITINSGFRSDAEQARLFASNPDPRWVARPGTSLHRNGTELDLGPPSVYPWLAANAGRFRFIQRYPWEAWHFGMNLNAKSSPSRGGGDGRARRGVPEYVPVAYRPILARAAQRWNVSATLLAAQLQAESNFNANAVSPAGARGIAQFMPGTAAQYGLRDPSDPAAAIDAQARLMRDLLRQFSAVPLALAAYNAGPARVQACMCIPAIKETQDYVAAILGRMAGAGEIAGSLTVRLVR